MGQIGDVCDFLSSSRDKLRRVCELNISNNPHELKTSDGNI